MNNNLKPVTTLPPFKRLCMSIGELPTSYLETMSYYEMLVWFTEYMKNTVIPTINNNGEAVSELQGLYIQLHDYVENYFENLDVQTEINKKLDEMADNGTLTQLIKNYVDPIYQSYETEINNEISTFKNNVNTQLVDMNARVEAATSGSPLVASSTSEMTETDRVYVNTTDGKWYYYDGDSWEIGGTYQATEDSNTVLILQNEVNYLKNFTDKLEYDPDDFELGGIRTNGMNYDEGTYQYGVRTTGFFSTAGLAPGTTIKIAEGYEVNVYYYNDDSLVYASFNSLAGWQEGSYQLDTSGTNYYYRLLIRKKNVSTTADVNTFVSKIYIDTSCELFDRINENTDNIEKILDEDIPDYWKTYLDAKLDDINEAIYDIGNHGDYFGFFTDYHVSQSSENTHKILKYLTDNTLLKKYINNGDILNTHTKEQAIDLLNKFNYKFRNINLLNVVGNHDFNPYANDPGDRLTLEELYPLLFKKYEESYIKLNKDCYYYFDNEAMKIRYIMLDTKSQDADIREDGDQLNWLVNTLATVPEGYGVIGVTHIFFGGVDENYEGTITSTSRVIRNIFNGYNTKTSGSTNTGYVTIPYDFTNANGEMICLLTGHIHNDYSLEAEGYPIICTQCDAYGGSNQNPAVTRSLGDYTEDIIDLFFIDTTAKTIKTIRIGAGSDRSFTYGTE